MQAQGISSQSTRQRRADLSEVLIPTNSPLVGREIAHLDAESWRVAAIERMGALIEPTGRTTLAPGDRLLLVGGPSELSRLAERLRFGGPDFPLQFGPNVVAYLPFGGAGPIAGVAAVLASRTRASASIRALPVAIEARTSASQTDAPLKGTTLGEHVGSLRALDAGVVVAAPEARSPLDRLLGRGGRSASLCDLLVVPVLFAREPLNLRRVVHVVRAQAPRCIAMRAADIAIDLARQFGLPLTLVHAPPPSASASAAGSVLGAVERHAAGHPLRTCTLRIAGDPVAAVARFVNARDLLVVTRRRTRRDGFSSTDVAMRLVHDTPCPVLVWTE